MGLALRWARAGEPIIIGSREAQRAQEAASEIKKKVGSRAVVSGLENSAPAPRPIFWSLLCRSRVKLRCSSS